MLRIAVLAVVLVLTAVLPSVASAQATFEAAVTECYDALGGPPQDPANPFGAYVGATVIGGPPNTEFRVRITTASGSDLGLSYFAGVSATDSTGFLSGHILSASASDFPLTVQAYALTIGYEPFGSPVLVPLVCPPATPEEALERLSAGGVLTDGETTSLEVKLGVAAAQAERGHVHAATNAYEAAVNSLLAIVNSGRITSAQAEPLITALQQRIDELRQ